VIAKMREEIAEVEAELDAPVRSEEALADEVGDLLFVVVNLARHLNVDPDAALRGTNEKFRRRFAHIEASLASEGRTPATASLDEMERLWVAAKTAANGGGSRLR
ncbi:MAG: nucleoside triphosphate pyrophosphohydrolase, partial [Rhizobiales bacterium]|nr:nucleoside triphosphate pyrophosphohydrolase [Hyphomicrobiales bacterium]